MSLKERIGKKVRENQDEIVSFCQKLIQFDSHVEPPSGFEGEVQEFMNDYLETMGLQVDMWEPREDEFFKYKGYVSGGKRDYRGRPNVVGTLPGKGGGRSLILNGHVDTVPIGPRSLWQHDPLGGEIRDGRIYGRGASDMKSGIAAMVMALKSLLDLKITLKGDLILESVVDEESTGNGTLACLGSGYLADAALVPEPSDGKIFRGHPGVMGLKITTTGKGGHASARWHLTNPVDKLLKIQVLLQKLEKEWLISKTQYPFEPPSIAQTMIHAGTNFNVVPETATLTCDIKYLPQHADENGFGGVLQREVEERISVLAQSDVWMKDHPPKLEWLADGNPSLVEKDHPIVQTIRKCVGALQEKTRIGVATGCSDVRYFVVNGIPGVWYGPGHYSQAHVTDEYATIESIVDATESIALFITDWCGS